MSVVFFSWVGKCLDWKLITFTLFLFPLPFSKGSDEQPQLTDTMEPHHDESLGQPVDKGLDLVYSLNDRPPWYLCILLGFQVNKYQFIAARLNIHSWFCTFTCTGDTTIRAGHLQGGYMTRFVLDSHTFDHFTHVMQIETMSRNIIYTSVCKNMSHS